MVLSSSYDGRVLWWMGDHADRTHAQIPHGIVSYTLIIFNQMIISDSPEGALSGSKLTEQGTITMTYTLNVHILHRA